MRTSPVASRDMISVTQYPAFVQQEKHGGQNTHPYDSRNRQRIVYLIISPDPLKSHLSDLSFVYRLLQSYYIIIVLFVNIYVGIALVSFMALIIFDSVSFPFLSFIAIFRCLWFLFVFAVLFIDYFSSNCLVIIIYHDVMSKGHP